jgi:NTE family protein
MAPSSKFGREKSAKEQPLVLVLGGGNALGSYLAGACEPLLQQAIEPQWIVGGSIGAVMGAIIAGNAPEDRLPRLKAFWDEAMIRSPGLPGRGTKTRHTYNELHTITTLLFGRPGLFGHRFPGALSMLPWMPDDIALYDHTPLRQTLERLVDFDRLNRSDIRLTVGCVDLESVTRFCSIRPATGSRPSTFWPAPRSRRSSRLSRSAVDCCAIRATPTICLSTCRSPNR